MPEYHHGTSIERALCILKRGFEGDNTNFYCSCGCMYATDPIEYANSECHELADLDQHDSSDHVVMSKQEFIDMYG